MITGRKGKTCCPLKHNNSHNIFCTSYRSSLQYFIHWFYCQMKRRLFQVVFSETDGERLRLHYWEFALWITLTLWGKKHKKCKSLLVLTFRKVSLVLFLEAEELFTWSYCSLPHVICICQKALLKLPIYVFWDKLCYSTSVFSAVFCCRDKDKMSSPWTIKLSGTQFQGNILHCVYKTLKSYIWLYQLRGKEELWVPFSHRNKYKKKPQTPERRKCTSVRKFKKHPITTCKFPNPPSKENTETALVRKALQTFLSLGRTRGLKCRK